MASSIETLHALRDAGMPQEQAEIIARSFEELFGKGELATKADLEILRQDLRQEMQRIKAELIKWMISLNMAFAALVLGGVYFMLAHFKA
jgi:hypothetical protein